MVPRRGAKSNIDRSKIVINGVNDEGIPSPDQARGSKGSHLRKAHFICIKGEMI